jgi:hypothetical protein
MKEMLASRHPCSNRESMMDLIRSPFAFVPFSVFLTALTTLSYLSKLIYLSIYRHEEIILSHASRTGGRRQDYSRITGCNVERGQKNEYNYEHTNTIIHSALQR